MPVRKKAIAKKKVIAKRKPSTRGNYSLPTVKREPVENLMEYIFLIYGRPGVGKTTIAASWPDTIMFSCEKISKGLSFYDFNEENGGVRCWADFLAGVRLLEESPDQFTSVCIDTIDVAYLYCFNQVCDERGVEYPPRKDYGQTWAAIRKEFQSALLRILHTGRGLVLTSHAHEVTVASPCGDEYDQIQPTISGQGYDVLKKITDNVFLIDYKKGEDGRIHRIIQTLGTDVVDAKRAIDLPDYLPFPKEGGYDVIDGAFKGTVKGFQVAKPRTAKKKVAAKKKVR